MAKKVYRLLKETYDLKKGILVREECDSGNQNFELVDIENATKFDDHDWESYILSRESVMKSPKWFEEVKLGFFPVKLPVGIAKTIKKVVTFEEGGGK